MVKKEKLPGQPKKPMSAYFLWMQAEARQKIKAENPSFSVTEVGKKSGEMWREMGEEGKKEWGVRAKEAKEAYDKENKEWLENGGAEAIKDAKKKAKKEAKSVGGASSKAKKSSTKKITSTKVEPVNTGGSGANFKSKEFIDEDSSDGGEDMKSDSDDSSD